MTFGTLFLNEQTAAFGTAKTGVRQSNEASSAVNKHISKTNVSSAKAVLHVVPTAAIMSYWRKGITKLPSKPHFCMHNTVQTTQEISKGFNWLLSPTK